ncbi:hypothetical protein, partial [Sphaerotilus natans]|uniref:hypothetical protein n=1 Tax=Sphaerotilus natans TaxID=34103 RepID=UPI001C37E01E
MSEIKHDQDGFLVGDSLGRANDDTGEFRSIADMLGALLGMDATLQSIEFGVENIEESIALAVDLLRDVAASGPAKSQHHDSGGSLGGAAPSISTAQTVAPTSFASAMPSAMKVVDADGGPPRVVIDVPQALRAASTAPISGGNPAAGGGAIAADLRQITDRLDRLAGALGRGRPGVAGAPATATATATAAAGAAGGAGAAGAAGAAGGAG